jgi:hypothetical protein
MRDALIKLTNTCLLVGGLGVHTEGGQNTAEGRLQAVCSFDCLCAKAHNLRRMEGGQGGWGGEGRGGGTTGYGASRKERSKRGGLYQEKRDVEEL